MATSTTLVSGSKEYPHTDWSRSSRDRSRRGCSTNRLRSANSLAVRLVDPSEPDAVCDSACSSRSPTAARLARASRAPGERAHASGQRGRRHGLDDVFVGAGVERSLDVRVTAAPRADHDRRLEALRPEFLDEPDAVPRGQAHVQHDDVVGRAVRERQRGFRRIRFVDREAVGRQRACKRAPHGIFVFDQEDVEGVLVHVRKAERLTDPAPVRRKIRAL